MLVEIHMQPQTILTLLRWKQPLLHPPVDALNCELPANQLVKKLAHEAQELLSC